MPYPAKHKERTRGRIVESARRLFNRYGFEQVSIDQVMSGAGLKQAYTDLIRGLAQVFRSALAPARDAERRAQAMVSLCVGGMVLARTTNDAALRQSLRAAARHQALALLEA